MDRATGATSVNSRAHILVEVVPDPSRIATAQAPGLVTVRQSWKYSYWFPLLLAAFQ